MDCARHSDQGVFIYMQTCHIRALKQTLREMSVPRLPAPVTTDDAELPVVRISPLHVFGLPPFWCIATCPTCDAAGFMQEDVHPLPVACSYKCFYGHAYRIELEKPVELDNLDL
jgi:hypothetical protein